MKKVFLLFAAIFTATVMNLQAADPVSYLSPVYNTAGDPTSGIKEWKTGSCTNYTVVTDASSIVTWNAGWYVVTGADVKLTAGAVCNGEVHLILVDGAKLTANGTRFECAGIQISNSDYSLTIYGQANQTGQLIATGADAVAGIGGSQYDGEAYNITINGGVVTATGGQFAAGIGGSVGGNEITINGGTVNATGGVNGAGIGGGNYADCSFITINGGTVTATGGDDASGIGGGKEGKGEDIYINGGTVTANGSNGASGIGSGSNGEDASDILVHPSLILKADGTNPPTTVIAPTRTATTDIAGDLAGKRYATVEPMPEPISYIAPVYNTAGDPKSGILRWDTLSCSSYTVVTDASSTVTWNAGWYVVNGADVKLTAGAKCSGEVHLILADGAKLTANGKMIEYAGIQISNKNYSLTIYGQANQTGQLIATGADAVAGIGGSQDDGDAYNITINGGVVTATGGDYAAGIGGLKGSNDITINGGTVTATGGNNAAGIGSGYSSLGEDITINGGTVTATGGNGAAGIGGGKDGRGQDIYINGGTITANGSNGVSGIGSGQGGDAARNIFVNPSLILKADNNNPPTTVIAATRTATTDVASLLAGKQYVMASIPDTLDYLHFVSLKAGGSVKMSKQGTPAEPVLEYSKDNRQSWSKFDIANGTTFDNVGDTIWFRAGKNGVAGTNATISASIMKYYYFAFGENDSIAAGGNIMSLLDGTCKQDSSVVEACFTCLFYNAKQLVSAPKLPATKLAGYCYASMFKNTGLVVAPELPATKVAEFCYMNMFNGCANLETAPDSLPAKIMTQSCYNNMFNGCAKLKHAPTIKITNLHKYCFQSMFEGCTNLQVDTISASCDGAVLEIDHEGSTPESWNVNMFTGCKGSAVYNITAGGHYCIKEFVPDSIKGVTIADYEGVYDGQKHTVIVTGTLEGDKIMFSSDSANWTNDSIAKNVGETLIYVRVQRKDHYDWFGKGKVTITAKELTVDGTTVKDKEYDGNTSADINIGSLQGAVLGDEVGITGFVSEFDNKNVGEDKEVTIIYQIAGNDAGNYTIKSDKLTASITPKQLTVAGIVVDAKTYNATTDATVSAPGVLEGVIGSDDVSIESATGAFADKDAGKDKDVSVVYTLKGEDAANYEVLDGESTATINPRELTLESADLTKEYDGTPLTAEGTTIKATGYVEGECLNYSFIGSQTAVDSSPNSFDYSDSDSAKVTNYDVIAIYGKLEVIPSTELITITAASDSKILDGTPLTNDGYQVAGKLGAGDYFENVTVTGTITQVGTAPNEVTGYSILNEAGEDVTTFYANVQRVAGTLTVKDFGTCAEANATPADEVVGLKPVVVTYVYSAYTYVKDATGASLIYADSYGLKAGDQVTGIIGKSNPLEGDLPSIQPSKTVEELTVVAGPEPEPEFRETTPTMNEIHQYVRYENVKIDSLLLTPFAPVEATLDNGDQIVLNSKFGRSFMLEEDETTTYDIVAIIGVRDGMMELYPIVISIHSTVKLNNVNADNRVVEKYVLDGQLYIRVNGVTYDAAGNRM